MGRVNALERLRASGFFWLSLKIFLEKIEKKLEKSKKNVLNLGLRVAPWERLGAQEGAGERRRAPESAGERLRTREGA